MKPILYILRASPAVRATLITIKCLNVDVDYHEMEWYKDFKKSEFLKLNPQHTVPTFVNENGSLWDSHAINVYLVSRYAKNDDLYPEDIYQRAIVNQRLYFEAGALFTLVRRIGASLIKNGFKEVPTRYIEEVKENYGFLEKFLEGNEWVAGKKLTLADFSSMTTVTTLDFYVPINSQAFPNITTWLERVQKLPCCSDDKENFKQFKKFVTMGRS